MSTSIAQKVLTRSPLTSHRRQTGPRKLPNNWRARGYQDDLWRHLHHGVKRALVIAHRRWGKDDVALHWTACASQERVGTYWHMLPQASQARKAIWDAVDPHVGRRRIDIAFPKALRRRTRENEMMISFKNGSTWQVVGSDNYDSLVGSPPVGVVFSEWALADPSSWAFIRPILLENQGWALFITTPRGRNHAWRMWRSHQDDEHWFVDRQSVGDTGRFTPEELARERQELLDEYGEEDGANLYAQEYDCSFDAAVVGSYYGHLIARLEKEGRVARALYDSSLPVYTAWDLGVGDSTAIWFAQLSGREIRLIDHWSNNNQDIFEAVKMLKERPYAYEEHIVPHDAKQRQHGVPGARTREDQLREANIGRIKVLENQSRQDGINAVRRILGRCFFERDKTADVGLEALRLYRKEWDAEKKCFKESPLHDWTSDHADAFRYLALGIPDKPQGRRADWDRPLYANQGTIA